MARAVTHDIICEQCGRSFSRLTKLVKKYGATYCSPACRQVAQRKPIEDRKRSKLLRNKIYYAKNKEKISQRAHGYYLKHKEEFKARKIAYRAVHGNEAESSLKRYHKNKKRYNLKEKKPARIKQKRDWHFEKVYGPMSEPAQGLADLKTEIIKRRKKDGKPNG